MGKLVAVTLFVVLTLTRVAWAQNAPDELFRAARAGDAEAQLEVGILYEYGFYMDGNRIPALAWYSLAAAQGHQKAIIRRDRLMGRMSPSEIEQARLKSAELVRAQPARVAKAEAPVSSQVTGDALSHLLQIFVSRYQAGDLEQFMGLFAEDVRTNERRNQGELRKDYEDFFQTTDLRRMELKDMNWKLGGGIAQIWGRFEVKVRKKGKPETKTYVGELSFHVEKQGQQVRITRLHHSQTKV